MVGKTTLRFVTQMCDPEVSIGRVYLVQAKVNGGRFEGKCGREMRFKWKG